MRPGKTRLVAVVLLLILITAGWWWRQQQTQRIAELKDGVIAAFAQADWERAVNLSTEWTAAEPDSGEAWIRHANALSMTGEHERALAALDSVPPSFDRIIEVRETRLNLLLRDLHRPFACRTACETLLQSEPKNETALHLLIYIDAMLLDLPALNQDLRRAIDASVETPDHYVYLMMLDNFALINGAEVTNEWLQEASDNTTLIAANAVHTLNELKLLQVKEASDANRRKLEQAQEHVEQLAGTMQEPCLWRSRVLTALTDGDMDAVRRLLAAAPESSLQEAVCLRARAALHVAENDLTAAATCLKQALLRHPLSFEARALQSDVLRRQGDRAAASSAQELAIMGTKIRETISAMKAVTDANPALLRRVANYARQCEDWEIAAALERRLPLADAPE
ncbi:MAG: hypothetical protein NXI04_05040 [Planctomycetaceae bacterium]|nr:hypothetical protein [Planctomycetaceae bacterium]